MTSLAGVRFNHILCTNFYFFSLLSHLFVPFYFVSISIYCYSLSISLESFIIPQTYILLPVSIRLTINTGVFCCAHCIRIQNLCPAALYKWFGILGFATDFVHTLHLQKAGVITVLLRLKVHNGWSKGRISKDSEKIIFGRGRPKRMSDMFLKSSEKAL